MPSIPSQKNSDGKSCRGTPRTNQNVLKPAFVEQLRHLGVVAERVDQPAGRDVDAELVAIIALAVLHLADECLAAGHVVVGHDVERTGQLQPAFRQEPAKIGLSAGYRSRNGRT